MGATYFTGFDAGSGIDLFDLGANFTIQGTIKRTGAYALKAPGAASPTTTRYTDALAMSSGYVRFYLYIENLGTPGTTRVGYPLFFRDTAGDSDIAYLVLTHASDGSRQLYMTIPGGTPTVGATAVVAGQWYLIEAKVVISATVGIVEWKLDGVIAGTATGLNTGSSNIKSLLCTEMDAATVTAFYVDDLLANDAAYPGAGQSIARQGKAGSPNADTWTKTSSQTAAQVWSETPYSATNEAHSTDQSQAQTMLVDDVGVGANPIRFGSVVNACKVVVIAKEIRAASGTPTYSIRRRLNGSNTDTAKALTGSDVGYDDGIWTDTIANLQTAEIGGVRGSGVDTISHVTAGTEGSGGSGNVTPGLPGSLAANDILICTVHSTDQVAHSMNATYWSQIVQGNGGGTTSRLSAWWHRYDGSTDPDRVVTHTAGDTIIAGISAFRGCLRTGSPIESSSAIAGGTDGSMETNGVSPAIDGCMILLLHGAGNDNNVTLVAGGYAASLEDTGGGTQNSFQSTTGTDGMVGLQYLLQTSKAATGTVTVTQAASNAWTTAMASLAPAAKQMQIEDAWLMVDYTVPLPGKLVEINQAAKRASLF